MTTTANSFLANGPATIGLEARVSFSPHPFKFGALAVGRSVGVVDTTSDLAAIPSANPLAGVYGASMWGRGLEGSGMTEGDCRGLYVRKSGASFEVRELAGGTSNVAFSYRIVGRRKDIRGHRRFAKIDVTLPVFPGRRRPLRGKPLARFRKGPGATPARRRRRRRGKRA